VSNSRGFGSGAGASTPSRCAESRRPTGWSVRVLAKADARRATSTEKASEPHSRPADSAAAASASSQATRLVSGAAASRARALAPVSSSGAVPARTSKAASVACRTMSGSRPVSSATRRESRPSSRLRTILAALRGRRRTDGSRRRRSAAARSIRSSTTASQSRLSGIRGKTPLSANATKMSSGPAVISCSGSSPAPLPAMSPAMARPSTCNAASSSRRSRSGAPTGLRNAAATTAPPQTALLAAGPFRGAAAFRSGPTAIVSPSSTRRISVRATPSTARPSRPVSTAARRERLSALNTFRRRASASGVRRTGPSRARRTAGGAFAMPSMTRSRRRGSFASAHQGRTPVLAKSSSKSKSDCRRRPLPSRSWRRRRPATSLFRTLGNRLPNATTRAVSRSSACSAPRSTSTRSSWISSCSPATAPRHRSSSGRIRVACTCPNPAWRSRAWDSCATPNSKETRFMRCFWALIRFSRHNVIKPER